MRLHERRETEAIPRILEDSEIEALLLAADETRYPERNRAIVLLACDAGLLPREIALLRRYHVLTDRGVLGTFIDLHGMKRKRLKARRIPIGFKTRLWWAIHDVLKNAPALPRDPLIISERALEGGGATREPGKAELTPMRPTSISYIFWKLFERAGITDAPTNCGRDTFLVKAGRLAKQSGAGLRELQEIAGHRSIVSTGRYLDYDEHLKNKVWGDLLSRLEEPSPRKRALRGSGKRKPLSTVPKLLLPVEPLADKKPD